MDPHLNQFSKPSWTLERDTTELKKLIGRLIELCNRAIKGEGRPQREARPPGKGILGAMRWRTAKMSWLPGSPPESVGEPQRCLFQRDFACLVLYASRQTPIVCKKSSVRALCRSSWTLRMPTLYIKLLRKSAP